MATKVYGAVELCGARTGIAGSRPLKNPRADDFSVKKINDAPGQKDLVFAIAGMLETDPLEILQWYRSTNVAGLDGLSPREALERGYSKELIAILLQWVASEVG